MKSFRHLSAVTVNGAISLLTQHAGRAKLLAGGTDLLGVLKDEVLPDYPDLVVNIKEIEGVDTIREEEGVLTIGALAGLSDIAASPVIRKRCAALAEAAKAVATPVIRSMATLGGNLCQDVRCWYYRYPHPVGGRILCRRKGGDRCPALPGDNRYHGIMGGRACVAVCPSDTAVALTALDAGVHIRGPMGGRCVSAAEFYTPMGTVLASDEMVIGVSIPALPDSAGQRFIKLTVRKPIDFALVSVAAMVDIRDDVVFEARICLGAVAPAPIRAKAAEQLLLGNPLTDGIIHAAADAALSEATPLSMNAYKVNLAMAAVRKALAAAGRDEPRNR